MLLDNNVMQRSINIFRTNPQKVILLMRLLVEMQPPKLPTLSNNTLKIFMTTFSIISRHIKSHWILHLKLFNLTYPFTLIFMLSGVLFILFSEGLQNQYSS